MKQRLIACFVDEQIDQPLPLSLLLCPLAFASLFRSAWELDDFVVAVACARHGLALILLARITVATGGRAVSLGRTRTLVGGAYALLNFGSGRGSNLCEALEAWPLAYPRLFAGVEKPRRATVAIMPRRAAASSVGMIGGRAGRTGRAGSGQA